ncbi:MAG: NUDIX domain-containing protein [Phycisphaerales bacterium]
MSSASRPGFSSPRPPAPASPGGPLAGSSEGGLAGARTAPLEIAVAALVRDCPQSPGHPEVLIARRRTDAIRGGLWELPGGKRDAGEGDAHAAARELREETGVCVDATAGEVLGRVEHCDADPAARERAVALTLVLFAAPADAAPQPLAASECRWERVDRLDGYEWPAANARVNALLSERLRAWPSDAARAHPPRTEASSSRSPAPPPPGP